MLLKIVPMFGKDGKNLINLRFVLMSLLGYFGFLRYSEIANLIRSDIRIFQDRLEFLSSKAKLISLRKASGVDSHIPFGNHSVSQNSSFGLYEYS